MAVMWPRKIPDWVKRDSRRSAEMDVFNAIKLGLSDEWHAFYSRPWFGLGAKGEELDGEADFIVAHASRGMLFLEVKGGRIDYSPENEQWYSTDRFDIKRRIKNPVEQAKGCKHEIRRQILEEYGANWVKTRFRHGVVFPHSQIGADQANVGGNPKEIFCMANQFANDFASWVEGRLPVIAQTEGSTGLPVDGMAQLETLIAAPVQSTRSKASQVADKQEEIEVYFTGAQRLLLASILQKDKLIIEGAAGTGKTLLALEAAFRYGKSGKKVLLICVGEPLAALLKAKTSSIANISVVTADDWLQSPDLYRACDVLIIDEAQDVVPEAWHLIETRLPPSFYIFLDSNQTVYAHKSLDFQARFQCEVFYLGANLRNTLEIAELTNRLYSGPLVQALGPQGPKVDYVQCQPDQMNAEIVSLLVNMIEREAFRASDIVVLLADQGALLGLQNFIGHSKQINHLSEVLIDTVANFKGLESVVVIVCADHKLSSSQELRYVAISRAVVKLFVVGPQENLIKIQTGTS